MFLEVMTGISTLAGLASSKKSGDLQEQGLAAQRSAQAESLAFQREQYERWKSIYGDIEENLGEFYGGLTPEYLETKGLQAEAKQFKQTMDQLSERFTQLGVSAEARADIEARAELGQAERKATIRAEAPYKVAELKQDFLRSSRGGPEGYGAALQTQAQTAGQQELMLSQQEAGEAGSAFGAASKFGTLLGKKYADREDAMSTPGLEGGIN